MLVQFRQWSVTFAMLAVSLGNAGCGKPPTTKPTIALPALAHPAITISEGTTHLTAPRRDDGYVDYVAAINDRASRGVTAENNSAVLLMEACGPNQMEAKYQAPFFELLGMPPLPGDGAYLQAPSDYAKGLGEAVNEALANADSKDQPDEQVVTAITRPWTTEEFPLLARWLDDSQKPLALAIAASERPKFYAPIVCDGDTISSAPLPATAAGRLAARALVARAMWSANRGDFDAAWSDLLASHRLARLVSHGEGIVSSLVGSSIERMACMADHAYMGEMPADLPRTKRMLDDLAHLSPLPAFADQVEHFERLAYLDTVISVAQAGPDILTGKVTVSQGASQEWIASSPNIDWNVALAEGNDWYDRIVTMHRLPTRAARLQATSSLDKDMSILAKTPNELSFLAKAAIGLASRADASKRMAAILICLNLPAWGASADAETNATVLLDLTKFSVALAAYRARHGKHPAVLGELAPEFLLEIPLDAFSGKAFRYQPEGDGYLLYSVGPNGKDECGATANAEQFDADDLAFRRD